MRIKDILMIQNYVKKNRNRSAWRKLVRAMACVVVFCTVYALILPVITMEQDYICGLEVHEHTDQCRAGPQNGTLLCSPESLGVHKHNSGCYASDGTLQCGEADQLLHSHNDRCYGEDQTLICQLPEVKEHRHSESCYSGDALTCGRQELYKHSHGSECYDENDALICGGLETKSHKHGDHCPVLAAEEPQYTCGLPEHIHTDACQAPRQEGPLPTEPSVPQTTDSTEPSQPVESEPVQTQPSEPSEPGEPAGVLPIIPVLPPQIEDFAPPTAPVRDPDLDLPDDKVPVEVIDPDAGESDVPKPGYPTAVRTGNSQADTLYFYNFEATGAAFKPLAGCVFEIRSTDGTYVRQITSGNALEVELPADIPVGDYVITELSAPYGYIRDDDYTRSFSIGTSSTLGGQKVFRNSTIGSFMNHSLDEVDASKTAEVENYNNRTYEIILSAGASVKLYEMEPIDVLFVVDQSNSMLFPSGLNPTGKSITLYQNPQDYWDYWWGPKKHQNTTPLEELGLDKSQVYYIIADPQGTSTVFALWHNGTSWMYQDASYYAKAYYDNGVGYRQDNETAVFPQPNDDFQGTWTTNGVNYKANGGDIGYALGGSLGDYIGDGGSQTFQIYTAANQYNRLHYLEESITQAIYQLSDANVENTVTVIRFTKEVDESHCMGPLEMTPENANKVVDAVNKIQTDGGTRQDLALQHAYDHLTGTISTNDGGSGDHYTKDADHTFTILITDGAPVRSGNDAPALDTIYQQIRTNGAKVRQESTLITIGLGMDAVEGGKAVLEEIASEPDYANVLDDASNLTELIYDLIFSSMTPQEHDAIPGNITDVISDSFYPIAWVEKGQAASTGRQLLFSDDRDWVILEPGDWIDVNGRYLGPTQSDAAEGQLLRDTTGDLVIHWKNRQLRGNPSWTGSFFVKAKEDFIGGNAIDTNKLANVEVRTTDNSTVLAYIDLPTPTVNVRLLDMNQHNSEVTVFLGDIINEPGNSPLNALEYFYYNTHFTKLIGDLPNRGSVDYGPIMNDVDPDAYNDGLEKTYFSLRYALGQDLTAEQWEHLMASEDNTVRVDYTYDNASSHGPVGYFTFRLTKSGDTADYQSHEATVAGEHIEDYILHVTYTAYELGESGRPNGNVHNGSGSPGTEVADENGGGRLEDGYGIVDKDNVHIVHVIEGAIEVTKEITGDLIADVDQTFRFTLHRSEDGDDHSADRYLEVIIPAGQTTATVRTENLPRGTWVLTEEASDVYNIQALTILDTTNCYSVNDGTAAVFHIGDDTSDRNVIGKTDGARYTSYTGSPEGVFGAAKVVNEKTIYYAEIPVQKAWGGTTPSDDMEAYVVLYRNVDGVEQLMLDTEGHARILRLDALGGWQGTFQVALPAKDADVTTLGYFVREVAGVTPLAADDAQSAILENDGTTILYYTKTAQPEDIIELGSNRFMVTYEETAPGSWTVTNHIAVRLPNTGGLGTTPYYVSGLLLVAAALIIGYSQRRRREGGPV